MSDKTLKIYNTSHYFSRIICNAMTAGVKNSQVVPSLILLPGPAFFYGILRGNSELIHECEEIGQDYYYCDHGYIDRSIHSQDDLDGFYRITKNDNQCDGTGDFSSVRFDELDIELKEWREEKDSNKIVIAPLSRYVAAHEGIDTTQWLRDVVTKIAKHTDREIVIKPKNSDQSLQTTLRDAHAFVAYNSNAMVDAILAGIPVFHLGQSCVAPVGCDDLSKIETPNKPDRLKWCYALSNNQWLLSEMRDGTCWEMLNEAN